MHIDSTVFLFTANNHRLVHRFMSVRSLSGTIQGLLPHAVVRSSQRPVGSKPRPLYYCPDAGVLKVSGRDDVNLAGSC